jgi:2-polyprenyl-6-methoxyphenol hydroxylase-like FAD-dependent oxidoreductase
MATANSRAGTAAVDGVPRLTGCCVVGGGPAGMMLGVLLARAGVAVTVLEKHTDFLRDFRGDTLHASTLTLLGELGLGERFAAVPHRVLPGVTWLQLKSGSRFVVDFGVLPGPHKHIAMVPQWDFLDLLAEAGREEPTFELRMGVEATGLLREHGRVVGVRYREAGNSEGELRAALTVACDGRTSDIPAASGLRVREFGVPLDVWWFRLPRRERDVEGLDVRLGEGEMVVVFDRGSYFQLGFMIRKGSDASLRAQGIESFRARVATLVPELADRVDAVHSWADVKLLAVRLTRMPRWWCPGLLCIGDAAHAMSPVGGVGINLAIQDAVAAARYLAAPLQRGGVPARDLARVQARRWAPTVVTQALQRLAHRFVIGPRLTGDPGRGRSQLIGAAWLRRLPLPLGGLQEALAYIVAIGLFPEHAPPFARRAERSQTSKNRDRGVKNTREALDIPSR